MAKIEISRLKELIHIRSQEYFTEGIGSSEELTFENDIRKLPPKERVATMLRLLKFTLPEMKATDISVDVASNPSPARHRLASLLASSEPNPPPGSSSPSELTLGS